MKVSTTLGNINRLIYLLDELRGKEMSIEACDVIDEVYEALHPFYVIYSVVLAKIINKSYVTEDGKPLKEGMELKNVKLKSPDDFNHMISLLENFKVVVEINSSFSIDMLKEEELTLKPQNFREFKEFLNSTTEKEATELGNLAAEIEKTIPI